MRTMYDSVSASSLPSNARMVAGYVDGLYRNVAALRTRFPKATLVRITVTGGTLDAHVADVERGDLSPQSGAAWAQRKHHAGQHGTLYCSTSVRSAVETECRKLGLVLGRDYSIWQAQYDGRADIPAGAVAKQYLGDHPNGHGGTYDASVVADHWPGVDPDPAPPKPQPPAPQPEGDDVRLYIIDGTLPVWITNGIHRRWVQTPAELAQYEHDFGIKPVVLPKGSTFLNDIAIVGPLPK